MKKLLQYLLFTLCLISIPVSCFSNSSNIAEVKEKRSKLVDYAKTFVGVPYVYGGLDRTGIDCSGLIYTAARESIQMQLPRTVAALYGFVKIIPNNQREPGDILFFKTVGDRISHAGIYIGNNQFIHAASDGPNTGVILSSLNETYWKEHYYAVGQILPPTLVVASEDSQNNPTSSGGALSGIFGKEAASHLVVDMSAFFNWNFFNAKQVLLNPRGFSLQGNISYRKNDLWPGLGLEVKYDSKTKLLQIPITFSLAVSEHFRFYAGPVFSVGSGKLPGSDEKITPSIFPGILGFSWQTDNYKIGKTGISFVQDINYSVYNGKNGAALSFFKSIIAGLNFSTGVRVTFLG